MERASGSERSLIVAEWRMAGFCFAASPRYARDTIVAECFERVPSFVASSPRFMDTVSTSVRSKIMRRVRSTNTEPEMKVRRITHSIGFRYRLHGKNLPGKPDLVFPSLQKVIFVHGCFWHGHNCEAARLPASNVEYWRNKQSSNIARDRRILREIRRAGWKTLVIWECELHNAEGTRNKIRAFLVTK